MPGDNDPTETPILAEPDLVVSKSDSLFIDADGDMLPSPGDTLRYSFLLTNQGNAAASNVSLLDFPDPNTELVVGSVMASQGTVVSGNDGNPPIQVDLGVINGGGASATVQFDVLIDDPLAPGVTALNNQALVSSDELPDVPSDDPDLPGDMDPTTTPLNANPQLVVSKSDSLFIDADGNMLPSPGDTLLYEITIINQGNAGATDVVFDDFPDPNTSIAPGSVATSQGTVVSGNDGNPPVTVDLGDIPGGGGSAVVTFLATIANPLPAGVSFVSNQAVVSSSNAPTEVSDDPDLPGGDDPTVTPLTAMPVLSVAKSDLLFDDSDGNGVPSPGDVLAYQVAITNSGNQAASGVTFNDIPGDHLTIVAGSISTSHGTVTSGNDGLPPITIDVGDLPGGGSVATISFNLQIDNPLPAGVTQVANQALVSSNETPDVLSDDPDAPGGEDPTETPITADPLLQASKHDLLAVDADGDGQTSPGDTLTYSVTITNVGNASALNLVFSDTPGAFLTLVAGSVITDLGTVTGGNDGNPPVMVEIGDLAGGGASATITFDVVIANPLPAGVNTVANQGLVTSDNAPSVPTDDPDTGNEDDETVTNLNTFSDLSASKSATLFEDADGSGDPSPGDVLSYTLTVTNNGNAEATNVTFSDDVDVNTALVAGSVMTTQGTVTGGNDGNAPVTIDIGSIPGNGGAVSISYRVVINNPLPAGVTTIVNQGFASSDDQTDVPTDDPGVPGDDDPTVVPVTAEPLLQASKADFLAEDLDGNGVVSPGDILEYVITISNVGNTAATDVTFSDTPDGLTTVVPGSVMTSQGTVNGESPIDVDLGTLPGASSAVVSFQVMIQSPLPVGVTTIGNQGAVGSNELPDVPTDDPDTGDPDDPTETPIEGQPILSATKTDSLFDDVDGSGGPSPGDVLEYVIDITNSGNQAIDVTLVDSPDPNTALVVGSVTASQGTVVLGNGAGDTTVEVDLGTIAGSGGAATVTFRVTIDNPLPPDVVAVENQAALITDELPVVLSDDPDIPGDDNPTATPLTLNPQLVAEKSDSLFADNDGNGFPSAGDELAYQITLFNLGSGAATGVVFNDNPDANTTLVVGSVTTSQGTITSGNGGVPPVTVDVGTINGGASVTIGFRVLINDPLPDNTSLIENQGVVESNELPDLLTDDPDLPGNDDPTGTPLGDEPELSASKQDVLQDLDGNGSASPGDQLLYVIVIENNGAGTATDVTFQDTPDPNTILIPGSVQTDTGAVVQGNDGNPPIIVLVGDLGPGEAATVSFQVAIADPLPAGVQSLVNQGLITSNEEPPIPTDDPDAPGDDDPTETPVNTDPVLEASKTDSLLDDLNGNGILEPGETLLYLVEISNTGNGPATNVVFSDQPDDNTSLVPGSIVTSQGTVTQGQAGTPPVVVDVGIVSAGTTVTISFQVTLNNPIPPGVVEIVNQGFVNSDELPVVLTDDPDLAGDQDPTPTPLLAGPILISTKVDLLFIDADGSGGATPGDTLLYQARVTNIGNGAATGVRFIDFPDTNTTLVAGSVQTSQGMIVSGNDGNTPVEVDLGTLPGGGAFADIAFQVTINDPLPVGVTQLVNQGVVESNEYPIVLTDDTDVPGEQDPTVTPLGLEPRLVASKTDVLFDDLDGNGAPSPGDVLQYQIEVRNLGSGPANNVVVEDTPDANTALVAGSVQTSQGVVVAGNGGVPPVIVDFGTIAANGASASLSYRVTIANPLPAGTTNLVNQGTVSSDELPDLPTDDPDVPGEGDPTEVEVIAAPVLEAFKVDTLFEDLNGDGVASPGDVIAYQISIINTGNVGATGVIFSDTPDPNTAIVAGSVQTSQGVVLTGNDGVPPIQVALGVINGGGGSALISFRVTIDIPLPVTVTVVENQGSVDSEETDPVLTTDPEDEELMDPTPTLIFQADLQVIKEAPAAPVLAGSVFDWGIRVRNNGPSTATGVTLTDVLDPALEFIGITTEQGTCNYDAVSRTVFCELGTVEVDMEVLLTLTTRLLVEGFVANDVVTDADQVDPDDTNNQNGAGVTGGPSADLSLDKSVMPTDLEFGDNLTYTIAVLNSGPSVATNVVVTDQLPPELAFVSASTSHGSFDEVAGMWSIPVLQVGETATLTIEATIIAIGNITNTAEITAADQADLDSTPGNGDPTEDDQDQVVVVVDTATDLQILKTVDRDTAALGDTLVYTLEATNLGPSPATGVFVTETVPPQVTIQSVQVTHGSYDIPTGIWTIGDLAPDETAFLELTVTVNDDAAGFQVINTAMIEGNEPDPDPSNNQDSVPVDVFVPIPVLGPWGMAILLLVLAVAAIFLNRARSKHQDP